MDDILRRRWHLAGWMCVLGLFAVFSRSHAVTLAATQARDHAGETATVCGVVASATFAVRTKGTPTFLNLDQPYPKQVFTAVIWGSDRPKFGQPEVSYRGKHICVTGTIKVFRGMPEIVVTTPSQISPTNVAR